MFSTIDKTILNCNGKILDLSIPKVMGIINLSQDSFYSASNPKTDAHLSKIIDRFLEEGVDIIDLGSASSRPKSIPLSAEEEIAILLPRLEFIRASYPDALISIDTYHKEVVLACEDFKINMVNDISGFQEKTDLVDYLAKCSIPYVLMHKKGTTQSMQVNPHYKNVSLDILKFLKEKLNYLNKIGLKDVIIDPGFGFGKTLEHNFELLNKLSSFKILECPILVGISRKSMIYKTLESNPEAALNGTTALHMHCLNNGAKILRVHDVLPAKECIQLHLKLQSTES